MPDSGNAALHKVNGTEKQIAQRMLNQVIRSGRKVYGILPQQMQKSRDSAGRRGKGPDPCRAEIPALFFWPCGREPKLCEARGGNMDLSEEIRR